MPPANVLINFIMPDDPYNDDIFFSIGVRGNCETVSLMSIGNVPSTHDPYSRIYGCLLVLAWGHPVHSPSRRESSLSPGLCVRIARTEFLAVTRVA